MYEKFTVYISFVRMNNMYECRDGNGNDPETIVFGGAPALTARIDLMGARAKLIPFKFVPQPGCQRTTTMAHSQTLTKHKTQHTAHCNGNISSKEKGNQLKMVDGADCCGFC